MIAVEDYDDLNEVQRVAHLVFWYDAEVQNGGHVQYFANSSGRRAKEAERALQELGMECRRNTLSDAVAHLSKNPLAEFESVDDYATAARDDGFEAFDRRYYACAKDANQYLEAYLERNISHFIELT